MKTATLTAIAIGLWGGVALAGNYKLTIDGKQYELDLGETAEVAIQGGQKVQVKLEKKEVAEFKANAFSFSYPSNVTPSKTDLGDGNLQTMMATPTGTLVIVQEYSEINPSEMIDLILTEATKEEVGAGYNLTTKEFSKKLSDGRTVTGKCAITKNRTNEYERYVLSHRVKDGGIVIITQVEKNASRNDLEMIDQFWKTMKILMK